MQAAPESADASPAPRPTDAYRFRDEFAFRDRLRSSLQTAGEYVILKHGLAQRFAEDREAYTDAKGDFIARVLRR